MKSRTDKIIEKIKEEFPDHYFSPENSDPLDMLIATVLSQNTNDKLSYKAYINLRKLFRNWDDILMAPLYKVKQAIKICGLSDTKSKTIKGVLSEIKKKNGKLSLDYLKDLKTEDIYNELLSFRGVGCKTASCVLLFSFGRNVFPVDTHIHRIANRLKFVETTSSEKTFELMKEMIPENERAVIHTLLILFGRKICKAVNPLCDVCTVYKFCFFKDKKYYALINAGKDKKINENNFIILEHI